MGKMWRKDWMRIICSAKRSGIVERNIALLYNASPGTLL